jgi:hypothetical protein
MIGSGQQKDLTSQATNDPLKVSMVIDQRTLQNRLADNRPQSPVAVPDRSTPRVPD